MRDVEVIGLLASDDGALATLLGTSSEAVRKWRERGVIPWRMRSKVRKLATKKRLRLPPDFDDERRQ